jgi:hypothetical protein
MLWQDGENQFRNLMILSGDATPQALEKWNSKVRRSFQKADGQRRIRDLLQHVRRVETVEGPGLIVSPQNDPNVMLIIRRIVRGLCAWHKLGTAIPDHRVWACVALPYRVSDIYLNDATHPKFAPGFFEYWYDPKKDEETNTHSSWFLRFYDRVDFVVLISLTDEGIKGPPVSRT